MSSRKHGMEGFCPNVLNNFMHISNIFQKKMQIMQHSKHLTFYISFFSAAFLNFWHLILFIFRICVITCGSSLSVFFVFVFFCQGVWAGWMRWTAGQWAWSCAAVKVGASSTWCCRELRIVWREACVSVGSRTVVITHVIMGSETRVLQKRSPNT